MIETAEESATPFEFISVKGFGKAVMWFKYRCSE